jgi:replication factor C subunit 3/5
MLWTDKYKPKKLCDLSFNNHLTNQLKKLCQKDIPNLIMCGPNGSGKHTRVMCCLNEIYGESVFRTKIQHREYKLPSKKIIEITTIASTNYIIIDLSEGKQGNKVIIQEIVDEIAGSNGRNGMIPLKVVVLSHSEQLGESAQHSLRKIMEKYNSACRFILLTNSLSKIIDQLRSRTLVMRVQAPNALEVKTILNDITHMENITIPNEIISHIADNSNGNVSKAIMTLQRYTFDKERVMNMYFRDDWEYHIVKTVELVFNKQFPEDIVRARENVYELMGKCINPSDIFQGLVLEILDHIDDELKERVVHYAAKYEYNMCLGGKPIIHMEAFLSKCMDIYKTYILKTCCECEECEETQKIHKNIITKHLPQNNNRLYNTTL